MWINDMKLCSSWLGIFSESIKIQSVSAKGLVIQIPPSTDSESKVEEWSTYEAKEQVLVHGYVPWLCNICTSLFFLYMVIKIFVISTYLYPVKFNLAMLTKPLYDKEDVLKYMIIYIRMFCWMLWGKNKEGWQKLKKRHSAKLVLNHTRYTCT